MRFHIHKWVELDDGVFGSNRRWVMVKGICEQRTLERWQKKVICTRCCKIEWQNCFVTRVRE